ncbi:spore germination protein GerKB [Desulfocucumis palustris]|uniref:Spore germination protein GerKB n=1 Tax=Desulfocucumis palustris TaxID=1898651 RepID=A0A2L2XGF3_9FIRM|nr:endospore germination permease [Desulfocucumis palustris]GBF35437.1 spore germination protein GerKB [Desulfocucumis palustris]
MEQQSISEKDLLFLVIVFLIGTAIMLVPPAVASEARQDAWLALLMGMILSIILAKLLISLQRLFPNESIIQYSVKVLGYPIGKAISGVFLWFALILSVLILRNIGDFVQAAILPNTPLVVTHTIVIIITACSVKSGLEVCSRISSLLFPLLILTLLATSILTLPQSDFNRLLPLMENGYTPLIHGAVIAASFPFGEIIIFSMILFQVNNSKRHGKFLIGGILIGFLILDWSILRTLSVLGVEASIRHNYPVIRAVEEAPASNILVILLTLNWFIFAFSKLCICFYAFTTGFAQWLNIKDHRHIITPICVIIVALSILIYTNYTAEEYYAAKINPYFKIPIELGIPLLIWLVAKIRFSK